METPVQPGNSGKSVTGIDARFFVAGRPIPQGSLKFINGHAIHVRAQDLALWRADIANEARRSHPEKLQGAVSVAVHFVFNRPKSVKRAEPSIRPDIDKLVRAVLDGLTDVVYRDDEQVTHLVASKSYGENQGVWISIFNREKPVE